ncbi:dentin sialophosphoprotein-like [Chironomus tepperi]|uniref:dentin sialophosphoprotein-like n=1 Tax=Chironomus tepperi TaxID=113505 RepID=UPI00391FB702
MTSQQELQRINDSTIRELAAIVESHNIGVRDQEIKTLREKLDKLKWELGMKLKTLKVREASYQILTIKHDQVQRQCKNQIDTIDNQVRQIKSFKLANNKKHYRTKMQFRQAKEDWEVKEQNFFQDIDKINIYIQSLHSTLERNGIPNDQYIELSDEYESEEFEVDWNEYLYRPDQYESDTQFEDDEYDESENLFQYQHTPYYQQSQVIDEESDDEDSFEENYESSQEAEQSMEDDFMDSKKEALSQQEQNQCSVFNPEDSFKKNNESSQEDDQAMESEVKDQNEQQKTQCSESCQGSECSEEHAESFDEEPVECTEEHNKSFAETIASKSDMSLLSDGCPQGEGVSNEGTNTEAPGLCDMIESEDSSQTIDPVRKDLSINESPSKDEQSQQASSTSKTETGHKVLKSEKPIESEIPMKINLEPFIHGYVVREKPKSKSKKQQQKKPKTKAKFSNLISFGGY